MRIVSKKFGLLGPSLVVRGFQASILALTIFYPALSHGQTLAPGATGTIGSAPQVITPPIPQIITPPIDGKAMAMDNMAKSKSSLGDTEDRVEDSAKDTIRHLGASDNVTMEDLNSAHQMVAKIEALIDVEKHLAELEKVQSDRENRRSLSSAIPMSALRPPSSMQASSPPSVSPIVPIPAPVSTPVSYGGDNEISRIVGSAGHYSAVVKTTDGSTKIIRVGDRFDGGKVTEIDASNIEVEQNGTHRTLHVKNVETVYGGSP